MRRARRSSTGRPPGRLSRRARTFLTAATVLVVATAGVVAWLRSDPADPVAVEDVVGRYRDAGTGPGRGVVDPGVYVYETSGSEEVDALDGSTHRYPSETTMTVTLDTDGCVTNRWDVLRQRWDSRRVCPDGKGGWTLREKSLFHSFFHQDETRTYTCEPGSVQVPADLTPGTTFTAACESEGSGQSGRSRDRTTGTVVGTDEVEVDGRPHTAVHLRYSSTVRGETDGEGTVDRWLSVDAMPLVLREVAERRTRSDTVIGTVDYHESFELQLADPEPRT